MTLAFKPLRQFFFESKERKNGEKIGKIVYIRAVKDSSRFDEIFFTLQF